MFSRMVASQVKHNSYFLCGLAIGLWLALVAVPLEDDVAEVACDARGGVGSVLPDLPDDELATQPPLKQAEGANARGEARALQRPRYYTTELGIRAPLLVAILTSEEQLDERVPALNISLSSLGASVRWFLSARSAVPPRQGLVAFTDTREMLRPFHVIKYLADNHLEDYDFFFLTVDSTYVSGRALSALVRGLGVSDPVHLGARGEDSEYCSLDGGILLSRSVLAALQGSLDWCVRNSYSGRHHENLGRCLLHATSQPARQAHKGMEYKSLPLPPPGGVVGCGEVTVRGVGGGTRLLQIHAQVARMNLERVESSIRSLSRSLSGRTRWPTGLRTEVGLPDTPPDSRFDVYQWSFSNGSHWLMPDHQRALAPLPDNHRRALQAVVSRAKAYLSREARPAGEGGEEGEPALVEAAWLWRPATDLTYRLLFASEHQGKKWLRGVEVSRSLGAARLVGVPYVTESGRVTLVRLVRGGGGLPSCRPALRGTRTVLVALYQNETDLADLSSLRASLQALPPPCRSGVQVLGVGGEGGRCGGQGAALAALRGAAGAGAGGGGGGLVLLEGEDVQYTDEFLNRVRMNCIPGVSWFLPAPRPRAPQPSSAAGFSSHHNQVYAFYYSDYEQAQALSPEECPLPALLRSPLRLLRAPDPALWRSPSSRPAPPHPAPPHPAPPHPALALGSRMELAKLLLQHEAGVHPD